MNTPNIYGDLENKNVGLRFGPLPESQRRYQISIISPWELGAGTPEQGLELGSGISERGLEVGGGISERGLELGTGITERGLKWVLAFDLGIGIIERALELGTGVPQRVLKNLTGTWRRH